jgi:hypothetical protein
VSNRSFKFILPGLMLLSGAMAHSQTAGSMTFTASPKTGIGSVTPQLRWTTSPVASGCTASGGWTGAKFASGSATVAKTTTTKSYKLTCSWGSGTTTINWTTPTTNTDGTALTDLGSFKILYGTSATSLAYTRTVSDPAARSVQIGSLGAGTWYFAVRAVNKSGVESANSNVASKVVTAATASKSVTVTVTQ